MSPPPTEPAPAHAPRLAAPWAWPLAIVLVVAILTAAALYVFVSLRDAPGRAVDKGREVLRDLSEVAAAFRQGTVETRFLSYATGVAGGQRFQFATLEQMEIFRRRDRSAVMWGQLELPDVVVEVTAPVTYTYYLDLDAPWRMTLEEGAIRVVAPAIEANLPAVDASEIEYTVRQGSLLRDEEAATANLKRTLTELTRLRARDHVPLVRELGRRETEKFVATWLAQAFEDGGDYRIEVVFADELGADEPGLRQPG
ncbi:MAG: hypothetical protein ACREF4_09820 [Gammaproteobacteria bacterium]